MKKDGGQKTDFITDKPFDTWNVHQLNASGFSAGCISAGQISVRAIGPEALIVAEKSLKQLAAGSVSSKQLFKDRPRWMYAEFLRLRYGKKRFLARAWWRHVLRLPIE